MNKMNFIINIISVLDELKSYAIRRIQSELRLTISFFLKREVQNSLKMFFLTERSDHLGEIFSQIERLFFGQHLNFWQAEMPFPCHTTFSFLVGLLLQQQQLVCGLSAK